MRGNLRAGTGAQRCTLQHPEGLASLAHGLHASLEGRAGDLHLVVRDLRSGALQHRWPTSPQAFQPGLTGEWSWGPTVLAVTCTGIHFAEGCLLLDPDTGTCTLLEQCTPIGSWSSSGLLLAQTTRGYVAITDQEGKRVRGAYMDAVPELSAHWSPDGNGVLMMHTSVCRSVWLWDIGSNWPTPVQQVLQAV